MVYVNKQLQRKVYTLRWERCSDRTVVLVVKVLMFSAPKVLVLKVFFSRKATYTTGTMQKTEVKFLGVNSRRDEMRAKYLNGYGLENLGLPLRFSTECFERGSASQGTFHNNTVLPRKYPPVTFTWWCLVCFHSWSRSHYMVL